MLKDYPIEGTLRFNVEQFTDQAQLGPLMDKLTQHISQNGIKFHPKEAAYLNDSVSRELQGRDPKTKDYPALTGPSLQQHFNLRDSHVSIHTERALRLRQIAQASPVTGTAAGNMSSVGVGASVVTGVSPPTSASAGSTPGASSTATASPLGPPAPPGPPRPTKSSSGLFVRKPTGSFLRNNAPRPMPLPRNPSAGQLPLRSPRLDGPTTPRLNQKMSRIQILDIQQGTEIMQSMNETKLRIEQAEQREKEMKKEQRAQEQELKRQQDAERKAQLQKEKDEKKKEREEAKKLKEKQKIDRDEQVQKERERQKPDRGQEADQTRETRSLPRDDDDDDDGEDGALSSLPAKKKMRRSTSRRSSRDDNDDYDYDNGQSEQPREPMSPITPSLSSRYSSHSVQDDGQPTPMAGIISGDSSKFSSNSYFPTHTQQQVLHQDPQQQQQLHQAPQSHQSLAPAEGGLPDHSSIFQHTNLLTTEDRAYIKAFLEGHPVIRPNGNETSYQIIMNQEQVQDPAGRTMYELILIEMNFETGEWRKIKRRRIRPHVTSTAEVQ
ncbi:hypothetical protein BGZ99_004624 [Dissophora globulifera]|uniref:Uncharacterized protein n=1 Tax=Dissophora globulifera TaxID=979702 RepID=A0A9P6UUU6_9FUNG|nr:hypothetical protein BGZ99_004624 [Dissophora globulifera]